MVGLANQITVGRGFITLIVWALLVWMAVEPSETLVWVTWSLFTVAAVTDFLDGMLARRMQDESVFGRIADPLVDKMLTMGTMIVALGVPGIRPHLPAWMVALMLTRELLVTALRGAVEGAGKSFAAVKIGKYKMTLQAIAAGSAIFVPLGWSWHVEPVPGLSALPGLWSVTYALTALALAITLYSAVVYVTRAVRALRAP